MAGFSHLKTVHSHNLHVFSVKSPSSSTTPSTLSSMKLKTLVHSLIFSHICRVARALSKAKSIFIHIIKEIHLIQLIVEPLKKNKNKNKLFFGSFRLHYNWCSSHVLPVPSPGGGLDGFHTYYDSTWNSIISAEFGDDEDGESQLSGYLQWLEENKNSSSSGGNGNDIDKLADMFIANCHEKFKLEKQESYRRFQEMMARSV